MDSAVRSGVPVPPKGDFVIDQFERSALLFPHAPAILCEDGQRINYQELNAVATKISLRLVEVLALDKVSHFQETPTVGLLMDRTIAIVAMMLGVHKAGCAYVPVDPAFPPDRQQYIMEHSRCDVLVVDNECYQTARSAGLVIPAKTILLSDHVGHIIARYGTGGTQSSIATMVSHTCIERVRSLHKHPDALAYVLYTSGSTGKPKGVAVKQVGVANIIQYFSNELHVDSTCKIMGLTTFCFDISVLETFVPLTCGAAIVLATGATRKDPFRIIELMDEHKVNLFQATPTTYEMMMATGWQGNVGVQFLVGGEAFRPSLLPLAKKCAALLNVYGPTETTIWSTCFRVEPDFDAYARRLQISGVPIGKAISETQLYLVGETQPWREVAPGEEGELFIGGVGVAAGYLHAPHLTVDKFIPNPFGGAGCVYRTGDVVRRLRDGNYIFVRRLDDQVKVDGFRIELEEIEKVFMQAGEVEQAVALVRENKLVLYLKLSPTVSVQVLQLPSPEDPAALEEVLIVDAAILARICERAGRSLTYYMMPKHVVIVRDFVKTPNGKLDKKALANPRELRQQALAASSAVASTAAGTATVELPTSGTADDGPRPVSALICDSVEHLRGKRPQPSSSLGAFGLDSLGSVMLMRQLGGALKGEVRLRMQDLFAPGVTIRDLGQALYLKMTDDARRQLQVVPERDSDDLEDGAETGAGAVVNCPDYFGASLLANKDLFEGLRGIFTFMVLWDHWHRHDVPYNKDFDVDTKLFFLISGYTTASQMRSPPEVTRQRTGLALVPKGLFPLRKFLLVRAVGMFPIMWLALVLYAPIWADQSKYQYPDHHVPGLNQSTKSATCAFLYVLGLNVLDTSCTANGPHVVYASSLIVNFLCYGAVQALAARVLHMASTRWVDADDWCSRTQAFTAPLTLRAGGQSWRAYAGKASLYLSYNLFHPELFWQVTLAVVALVLALLEAIALIQPNPEVWVYTDIWLFFCAAWVLTVSEMWCGKRVADLRAAGVATAVELQGDLSSPSVHVHRLVHNLRSCLRNGWRGRDEPQYAPLLLLEKDEARPAQVLVGDPHRGGFASAPTRFFALEGDTAVDQMRLVLWRFAPDVLAVGMALQLTCLGDLCKAYTWPFSQYSMYLLIPAAFLAFVAISVQQRGLARHNFSRLLLESAGLPLLGYCSYPVYLLQVAFLRYYFPYIFPFPDYRYHPEDPDWRYFAALPLFYRFVGMLLMIALSWAIQRFFQDRWVVGAFSTLLARWS